MTRYYVGDYREDARKGGHRDWIIGKFMEERPRKTSKLEVKYWDFHIGKTDHPPKESKTLECTFILSGKVRGNIDGNEVTLSTGQYAAIRPGVPNNLVEYVIRRATGLTIKAPSDPRAKRVLQGK
jgi:quercetin dioxygenase-like cupin family protein